MHHPQLKRLLKAIEIAIPVQQFVFGLRARRRGRGRTPLAFASI